MWNNRTATLFPTLSTCESKPVLGTHPEGSSAEPKYVLGAKGRWSDWEESFRHLTKCTWSAPAFVGVVVCFRMKSWKRSTFDLQASCSLIKGTTPDLGLEESAQTSVKKWLPARQSGHRCSAALRLPAAVQHCGLSPVTSSGHKTLAKGSFSMAPAYID